MVNSTGFVQAPQVALPEVAQTFEVPKVPTHTQTFGVPQVPTTGGGFLAPSGPGQPATSTVPSLSPSSGGGGGFGIDGSTLALGGGAAALAAALGAAGQKANGGGGILSPENILSGLLEIGDLTKLTGDGSILDKLLPEGFDLTSLSENVVESVSNFLGIEPALPAPTTASGFFSGAGSSTLVPIFSAPGVCRNVSRRSDKYSRITKCCSSTSTGTYFSIIICFWFFSYGGRTCRSNGSGRIGR